MVLFLKSFDFITQLIYLALKKIFLILSVVSILWGCQSEKEADKPPSTENKIEVQATPEKQPGFTIIPFEIGTLPPEMHVKGKIIGGKKWSDANGENTLILSTVEPFYPGKVKKDEPNGMDAELYATLFVKKNNTISELWKIQDYVRDCPLDIVCMFLPEALTVTDLDGNNIAETTIIYRTACRGDVSPATQKLIMYNGISKLAIRGTTAINIAEMKEPSVYTKDAAWKEYPAALLNHAETQWKKFELERFGS